MGAHGRTRGLMVGSISPLWGHLVPHSSLRRGHAEGNRIETAVPLAIRHIKPRAQSPEQLRAWQGKARAVPRAQARPREEPLERDHYRANTNIFKIRIFCEKKQLIFSNIFVFATK